MNMNDPLGPVEGMIKALLNGVGFSMMANRQSGVPVSAYNDLVKRADKRVDMFKQVLLSTVGKLATARAQTEALQSRIKERDEYIRVLETEVRRRPKTIDVTPRRSRQIEHTQGPGL